MTRGEGRRHRRKYAKGNLGPDWTFVFRGPGQRLSLRARNLSQFLELAEGVDDETRMYHFLTFASATTPPGSPTVSRTTASPEMPLAWRSATTSVPTRVVDSYARAIELRYTGHP